MHRVIALVDMDCFYCQVEAKLSPDLCGKPMAVVQYNAWKGGGIIAVNYEARDRGVTRYMRGEEAKQKCPDIELVRVSTIRDKADLSKYRDASRDVISVLSGYSDCIERASIDEAYIDLTNAVKKRQEMDPTVNVSLLANTFIVGYSSNQSNDEEERASGTSEWLKDIYNDDFVDDFTKNLATGAAIVEEMRADVYEKTGFRCSAGIAHNKILAKLVCGLHKPNRQTVLPQQSVPSLYESLPVKKVRSLGGKFGDSLVENLGCKFMTDLLKFSERELQNRFDEKTGSWLYNIARGIDSEPVTARLISKSIGCCKRFPGKNALKGSSDVEHWITKLSEELSERLVEDQSMNKRRAKLLTVSMTLNTNHQATSKSIPLPSYDADKISSISFSVIKKVCSSEAENKWLPIYCLGISAGKFMNITSSSISHFLKSSFQNNKLIPSNDQPPPISIDTKESVSSNSFFGKFISKSENLKEDILSKDDVISEYFEDSKLNENESEFSKGIMSFIQAPRKSDEFTTLNKEKMTKSRPKTIENFLAMSSVKKVLNPLEIFPDLSVIDEEMLSSFPLSFRKKVIQLKETMDQEKTENQKEVVQTTRVESLDENSADSQMNLSQDIFDIDDIRCEGSQTEMETCPDCSKVVEKGALREHMDHHLAERIHKEINNFQFVENNSSSVKLKKSANVYSNSTKRKSSPKDDGVKKFKTLKNFFSS